MPWRSGAGTGYRGWEMARACAHCTRSTNSSDAVARAEGWRWYDGPTMGGKRLVDVVCPFCAGARIATDAKESWNAGCETCGWTFAGDHWDDDDEPLRDARDAREVALDHECEPERWITAPDGRRFSPDDFDRNGKLRKRLVGAGAADVQS